MENQKFTEVKLNIDNQTIEDLLVTALEGGSNYWAYIDSDFKEKPKSEPISTYIFKQILKGFYYVILDVENEETELGVLNKESIIKGTQLLAEVYTEQFGNIINEQYDAGDADVWFQLCVMREVIYG